ncbi:MAG TPA: TIGR03790 family protein [Verrucomicrobiae bacterium]|nr:TIGR03790 family protein [Verrucomicrobiae bacterium]
MTGFGRSPEALLRAAALALLVCGTPTVRADEPGKRVVLVYNAADPDSRPLADYYALKRGVPTNQICGIHAPVAETISRTEYNETIRDPVWQFLTRQGLIEQEPRTVVDPVLGPVPSLVTVGSKISCLVLLYGVPLRINSDTNIVENLPADTRPEARRNEASVESELATLPTTGVPLSGPVRNLFFKDFSEEFGPPLNRQMLLVGRLDGPDPQTVRRMIDDALKAERYGLHGRAYFDLRGIQDKAYKQGDDWMRASYRLFRDAGYECDLDDTEAVFDQDYPMTDAAIYVGWYAGNVTGPFLRPDFRFKTGAVAYHLHSFSGQSVRTRTADWVGPLLAKGAAATMGNVFEPYLTLSPRIDIFFERLLDGAQFLEAGYCSEPVLSWQTTFVGDPLYRPFAVSLDKQIERLKADQDPDLEWAYLRKVNLLRAEGGADEAEDLCRTKAKALSSVVLEEKLGDLLRTDGRNKEAITVYTRLLEHTTELYHKIRITSHLAGTYESDKQPKLALAYYEQVISLIPDPKNAIEYYRKARGLAIAVGDDAKAKTLQMKIDELVPPPPPPPEPGNKK